MNKELIEKLEAIRKDLVVLHDQAEAGDKKLAELVKEKVPPMIRIFEELFPYMTPFQKSLTFIAIGTLVSCADTLITGGKDYLTKAAPRAINQLFVDVSDLTNTLKWLGAIADRTGCPVSELARLNPANPIRS
jgi:hypothetical protein